MKTVSHGLILHYYLVFTALLRRENDDDDDATKTRARARARLRLCLTVVVIVFRLNKINGLIRSQ